MRKSILALIAYLPIVLWAELGAASYPQGNPPAQPGVGAPAGMVLIPEAKYAFRNGEATQQVFVKRFYLDVNETTWGEYEQFLKATRYEPSAMKEKEGKLFAEVNSKGPRYPVGFVSYVDAKAYCAWKGKRLPTTKEWQLAALGTDGRSWPWGAWDPKAANVNTKSVAEPGHFSRDRSPYGVMDMGGNMLEWTTEGSMGGSYVTDFQSPTALQRNLDDWVANTGCRCAADPR